MARSCAGKRKSNRARPDTDKVASDAVALRMMRSKFAPRVLELAKKLREAAEGLMDINEKMDAEAKEITGDDKYTLDHTVSFEEHGSMNEQIESLGEILSVGFEDVLDMASSLAKSAEEAVSDFPDVANGVSAAATSEVSSCIAAEAIGVAT